MDIHGKLTETSVLPFNSFSSRITIIIYEYGKANVFREYGRVCNVWKNAIMVGEDNGTCSK